MSTALLATKFFAPPRPAHDISRPRLLKRFDEGLSSKLTLVCAAAGFGKSTLISQWAQECPYPSAWLSLGEGDRNLDQFLTYLVASIDRIFQTVDSHTSALLRGSPPASAETVLTSLVNRLSNISGKLVVVLDDYHLAASPAVNEALTFFIDRMPAQLHLVVASREEPEISLGRLRGNGQLTEIRQQDLRFALEEAVDFFNSDLANSLSKTQVAALEARTEGWISGLKLAAISLRMHKNPDGFIAAFTGGHHFIQDYLIEEVLHQQSAEVQSFLLRTSVLDRLCGPLCDAVLQNHGGQETLNQLDNANLFIVPLDAERRWYRYHHLFSDVLRQRRSQNGPAESLHVRASQWYEVNGLEVEAFQQAALANDLPRAIRLIDGNGMPLYFRGQTTTVAQWLSSLPQAALNTYPSLCVAFAWSLLFAGQPGQIEEKLLCAEAAVRVAPQDPSTSDTNGQIAVLWAWLAVYKSESDAIYTHASCALELLSLSNRPARTAAHCALGVAQMFRGERAEASAAFSKVIGAGRSSGNLMFAAVASTALAGIQAAEYKLHLAAATYRGVIQMIADPNHVLGFEAHLGLAKILYDWNELDEAGSLALLCSELVTRANNQTELGADILRARLMLVRDEATEAEALLARFDGVANAGQSTDRMREAADLRVLLLLRGNEIKKAADFARTHELPLGIARTQLVQGKGADALLTIVSHRRSMEAQFSAQEALKAMVAQTIVLDTIGEIDAALKVLRMALAQAESQGSIRLFVDEGAPMKTLLTQLQNENGVAQYVSKLLAAFGTETRREKQGPMPTRSTPVHLPLNSLSERELDILRLIQEGHSNQNISDQLFLSLSTVKWHNQNIFAKLDVQRRTEAVARALQLNLL